MTFYLPRSHVLVEYKIMKYQPVAWVVNANVTPIADQITIRP